MREGVADRIDGRDLEFNAWVAAAATTDDPDGIADEIAPLFRRRRGGPLVTDDAGRERGASLSSR